MPTIIRRASPMTVEDRQSMIVDAVIPLLIEYGASLTSRQIAEAAALAEGTVFRAFGDKDSVIRAAVDKYLDPAPLREGLAAIELTLPLEEKLRLMLHLLQNRFSGVFQLMAALGATERPRSAHGTSHEYADIVARVLRPDLKRLNCSPDHVAHLLRLVAFSTSLPPLNQSHALTDDDIVSFVLHGLVGRSADCADAPEHSP